MTTERTTDEKTITDAELCEWLGISRNTSRAWRKAGRLPFIRPGGWVIRYRASDVRALIRRGENKSAAPRHVPTPAGEGTRQ